MPRKPRHIVPGGVYHLISRFVDREWFITSPAERSHYLSLLGRALNDSDWKGLGYGVMSNHVHLAVVAGRQPLSSWIRRVHSRFADTMNRAYDRIGSMFVRGPKAFLVPSHKVARVLAYIHNNPVRAGVVQCPVDSDWTSHRAYVGADPRPGWLDVNQGLERAGLTKLTFDDWVRADDSSSLLRTEQEAFDALELEEALEPDARPAVNIENLVQIVADVVGVSVEEMRSRRRKPGHVLARHVLAHSGDLLGLSGTAVARAIGASQQSISKILTQTGLRGSEKEIVDVVVTRIFEVA